MHPEGSIRINKELIEENGLVNIFRKVPGLPTWRDEGLGVLKFKTREVTVWYEPLEFAVPTKSDIEDIPALYRVSFGMKVEGVNPVFLAEGGESTAYNFQFNGKALVVTYIRYTDVLSGIDRLESTVLLRREGCEISKPYFATNRAIISEFVIPQRSLLQDEKGDYERLMQQEIDVLIQAQTRLEGKGLWKPWWRIDWNNRNNFIPIIDLQNNLVSVCNVDPVAVNRGAWLTLYYGKK